MEVIKIDLVGTQVMMIENGYPEERTNLKVKFGARVEKVCFAALIATLESI